MARGQSGAVAWLRRPRRPLSGIWLDWKAWLGAVLLLPTAFLLGVAFVATGEEWWAKAGGFLVSLLSVVAVLGSVAYLLRPVGRDNTKEPVPPAAVAHWAAAFDRHGHVQVSASKRRVALTFTGIAIMLAMTGFAMLGYMGPVVRGFGAATFVLFLFAALLPHLEAATAGRPALRVDSQGIEIARWFPLAIPWPEVLGVEARRIGQSRQFNVVVHVTDTFFDKYQTSRPLLLRLTDAAYKLVTGSGFSVPATLAVEPRALALWLDTEALRRNPAAAP